MPITLAAKVSSGCTVARAHQRLGGQVEHDLGPRRLAREAARRRIADVADMMTVGGRGAEQVVQARRGLRGKRQPGHLRPQARQPQRQPGALEAGVAGEENALASPEVGVGSASGCSFQQDFQGAFPD